MQLVQIVKTSWFLMGFVGCACFGSGLLMLALNYYYCGRIWHSTFLQASSLMLVGLVMIMTADAIKKIEDRLRKLEARQQGEKQFDASSNNNALRAIDRRGPTVANVVS